MRAEGPRVVVIIPAVDEEEAIAWVLAEVPPLATEVIVVDNGSRDRTADVARAAGARVVQEPRRGYGRACLAGIAELNGAKGAGMTPAERTAVHAHLASHLDDGDRDVPDLKATPGGELKFHEEAAHVLAAVENLIGRTSEVMALRRSRGKAISPATVDVLEWVYDDMKALRSLLDSPQEDADREYARFIHLLHTDVSGEATP